MQPRDRPSPNHGPRPAGVAIDMLILHYTGMPSAAAALERLCSPQAQVSAHYVVEEDGTVWRLVPEEGRAWHAGVSAWAGRRDINDRSIGVELVNPGHEFGYRPFPAAQMEALADLAGGILARHPIPPRNVVGHADVAAARKQDPGELFDWRWLAARGIGLWPREATPRTADSASTAAMLARWGYDLGPEAAAETIALAITAFQRHFRPSLCDGATDAETVGLLAALLAMVGDMP